MEIVIFICSSFLFLLSILLTFQANKILRDSVEVFNEAKFLYEKASRLLRMIREENNKE